ncbi:hypothetical protein [Nocardioides euryhalodurans]|uniref:hypothetical protein n=1 Tax=Nocardioides euryhalodurans TaxID=2518370 RepID=UPI001ABEA4FB|nr:hypothetical protein [Nocardioides euryhalodurans]
MSLTDDTTEAARLIAFGLRPKLLPARDLEYTDLVVRYHEDETFADVVKAVADGFMVTVLGVSKATGIVLAPREESVFAMRFDDYARRSAMSGRSADKVIHGLAHVAIAALAFPRPDDLANDTYVGTVTVDEVDAVIREACRVLEERAKEAEENNDPLDTAPDLERAWRAYSRRPAATATKDGRLATDSTRGMITKAVRFLIDQGFLTQRAKDTTGVFNTTPKYQVQVRELAATAAFRELLDLGVITVTDPRGTLNISRPTGSAEPSAASGAEPVEASQPSLVGEEG